MNASVCDGAYVHAHVRECQCVARAHARLCVYVEGGGSVDVRDSL